MLLILQELLKLGYAIILSRLNSSMIRLAGVVGQNLEKQDEPIKLNIIGSFKPEQGERVRQVRHILEESSIELYTAVEMANLIKVIEEKAHL